MPVGRRPRELPRRSRGRCAIARPSRRKGRLCTDAVFACLKAETTLDIGIHDTGIRDEMLRVLMGDKVEPRREFIEKHALEVRNLDV